MAETQSKRQREEISHETHQSFEFESDSNSKSKRHKSYDNILSILDEESEENEPNHDLSAIFSTFENELSTTTTTNVTAAEAGAATDEQDDNQSSSAAAAGAAAAGGKGEEDDSVKVIRHLLEASDDELGIPNYPNNGDDEEIDFGNYNGLINASFDGFWELEDEAANYYTVLQSELFM